MEEYGSRGFTIIALPTNQFMPGHRLEPGTPEAIKAFMRSRNFRGVVTDKVAVNGRGSSPVINFLKVASGNTDPIPWPYTKWLVGRDGRVYGPYMPRSRPARQEASIVQLLEEGEAKAAVSAAEGVGVAPGEHDTMLGTWMAAGKMKMHRHRPEDDVLPSQVHKLHQPGDGTVAAPPPAQHLPVQAKVGSEPADTPAGC